MKDQHPEISPPRFDEMRQTTCYMCACRCGINVHLKNGQAVYIEGNRAHPVNKGVLCAKGAAGLKQVTSKARLSHPMRRVGPRGSGKFEKITWDEALAQAVAWLKPLREQAPEKLAFFTGRDQSQSLTSYWAQNFGTPNYAAHGGFCSVNMAAAGIYTIGGSFWEFGEPDWEHTKLCMLFGVAEDHDSNPIKIGLGKLKSRGGTVIAVNPIRTGYNAIADEWVGITPGTDGLFILSLIHELFKSGRMDLEYLAHYTNAPVLINCDESDPDFGQFLKGDDGKPMVIDRATAKPVAFDSAGITPDLGRFFRRAGITHRPVFHFMADRYLDQAYAPERVSARVGVKPEQIKAIAAELARVAFDESFEIAQEWTDFRGHRRKTMRARPVSFHAMRGISAHANGFQTCRALHILQILLGSVEAPGGFRFKPPYPKPSWAHTKPHCGATPGAPLDGPHLGFVQGPEDLLLTPEGAPARIDKAFSWDNPFSAHGMMHMVIANAHAGDPYKIDTLFLYMANMAWNSSMNSGRVMQMLTDRDAESETYAIPHIIYCDAYASEMVAYADLILPDTTYLERHDCISLLDRPISDADGATDAVRWPVVTPKRDVRGFQSVLLDLGARLQLPGFVDDQGTALYTDYADYIVKHERRDGIGPLMGYRMGPKGPRDGRGGPNEAQLDSYIKNGGFCRAEIPKAARYFKPWNNAYQDWAVHMGFYDHPTPYLFQLYLEPLHRFQMAAAGYGDHHPPAHLKAQILERCDPLPIWYPSSMDDDHYPLHALTQRPAAMYHSWGAQNTWLRQIHGTNPLFVPSAVMQAHKLIDGDWVRVTSRDGSITARVKEMAALNPNTIWTWNAIGKRRGTWGLEPNAREGHDGFLLNHLISELLPPKRDGMRWSNSDPITGQAAWFDLRVRIEKIAAQTHSEPQYDPITFEGIGK